MSGTILAIAFVGLVLGLGRAARAVPEKGDCSDLPAPRQEAGIHKTWDQLVRAYVRDGVVDYACFAEKEELLDAYLETLAETEPSRLSRDDRMALWINAYNAFTVKLILRKWPDIESIKDIPDRWTTKWWTVGGKKVSLDQIEHEILRPKFKDYRIHFAVNCASKSCPDLRSEAFIGDELDAQLDDQARRFLADETKGFKTKSEPGTLWGTNRYVYLSMIFYWFDDDFERGGKTLLETIKPHLPGKEKAYMKRYKDDLELEYFDYDWSLNDE